MGDSYIFLSVLGEQAEGDKAGDVQGGKMPIWKITPKGPVRVSETKLEQEKLLEENLEDWVVSDPSLLGEPLLIVGRQVIIPDVKDRLDILALDPQGKAVVVELKRGRLTDPVDMQAIRYASYISKWRFEDFENQARVYLGKTGDPNFNFNELYEEFCARAGIDAVPDLNSDQRLIIVGSEVRDKLGSVALWLLSHNIDIKVIEVELYREDGTIFVQPNPVVPLPVSKFRDVGRTSPGEVSQPWITDGEAWHLEKRCSPTTKAMLLQLDRLISDNFEEVDGPRWNQKFYVAYRVGNYIWLYVRTQATILILDVNVEPDTFDQSDLAEQLGVEEFDKEHSLAEKFGLPSSVQVEKRTEARDSIRLRIKDDFDLEGEAFTEFLKEAYAAFPR